jgi:hypothetical protein
MTNEEFKQELQKYRFYLKPELYDVLVMVGDVFSVESRVEIINKFKEAEMEMKELADYQKERVGILQRGLTRIQGIYENIKSDFRKFAEKNKITEEKEAEKLITNL